MDLHSARDSGIYYNATVVWCVMMKRVEWLEKALEHGVTAARKRKEAEAQPDPEVAPPPPQASAADEVEEQRERNAAAARATAEKRAAEVAAEAAAEKEPESRRFPLAVAHRRPERTPAKNEAYEYLETYEDTIAGTWDKRDKSAGKLIQPSEAELPEYYEDEWQSYQQEATKTALHVKTDHPVVYPTLGLANEAGEVAGKIKKIFRDKQGKFSNEDLTDLKYELGDVLWYLSQVCTALDLDLGDVAEANLKKLFSRKARGKLQGDGDKR